MFSSPKMNQGLAFRNNARIFLVVGGMFFGSCSAGSIQDNNEEIVGSDSSDEAMGGPDSLDGGDWQENDGSSEADLSTDGGDGVPMIREDPRLIVELNPHTSLHLGDDMSVDVKLTDQHGVPLPGRKIVVAINEEYRFKRVIITDSNGAGSAVYKMNSNSFTDQYQHYSGSASIANAFTSSCCKSGSPRKPMFYPLNIIFTGDEQYNRQELTGQVHITNGIRASFVHGDIVRNGPNLEIKDFTVPDFPGRNVKACVEYLCSASCPSPCTVSLAVGKFSRGPYALQLVVEADPDDSDPANNFDGVLSIAGIYLDNPTQHQPSIIRGLYRGWDYNNADPATDTFSSLIDPGTQVPFKDAKGNPLSFHGTDIVTWNRFDQTLDGIVQKGITIRSPEGPSQRKKYVLGITPITTENCPKNVTELPSVIDINGDGNPDLPDFHSQQYTDAFKAKLAHVAQLWRDNPEYQDVLAGVRMSGGFQGEWGNGPVREAYCTGSEARVAGFYGYTGAGAYDTYKNQKWGPLMRNVTIWAQETADAYPTADGKKLYFIFEGKPVLGYNSPSVGWKFNALLSRGPETCFNNGPWVIDCLGTYTHLVPNHCGGLESRYGMFFNGVAGIDPHQEAFLSPAYWLSLTALKTGIELFDFHSDYWHFYTYTTGYDLLMQEHLGRSCDEVGDGWVVFRELEDPYKKEKNCHWEGSELVPDTQYAGFACSSSYYGDYDFCLYSPQVEGLVDFQPVANEVLPGDVTDPNTARGRYYVLGRKTDGAGNPTGEMGLYQMRKLVSPFAYLDIDEGITSRAPHSRWKIRLVYLDVGTDTFSLDYYKSGESNPTPLLVTKTDSKNFLEAVFVLDDLRTDNPFDLVEGKRVSADLRLNNQGDGPDTFHSAQVIALDLVPDFLDPQP